MYWWEFEDMWDELDYVRYKLKKRHRYYPRNIKKRMLTSILYRIEQCFEKQEFGVISASQSNVSKKENMENQYILAQQIVSIGHRFEPHIGFWDNVGEQCFFIPKISYENMLTLAKKYGQKAYIWGKRRFWKCFEITSGHILSRGSVLKVISPDEEFLVYGRIQKRKQHFLDLLGYIKGEPRQNGSLYRKTVAGIKRKLADLDRIEDEMVIRD